MPCSRERQRWQQRPSPAQTSTHHPHHPAEESLQSLLRGLLQTLQKGEQRGLSILRYFTEIIQVSNCKMFSLVARLDCLVLSFLLWNQEISPVQVQTHNISLPNTACAALGNLKLSTQLKQSVLFTIYLFTILKEQQTSLIAIAKNIPDPQFTADGTSEFTFLDLRSYVWLKCRTEIDSHTTSQLGYGKKCLSHALRILYLSLYSILSHNSGCLISLHRLGKHAPQEHQEWKEH